MRMSVGGMSGAGGDWPPGAMSVTLRVSSGRSEARQRTMRLPYAWPTRWAGAPADVLDGPRDVVREVAEGQPVDGR